MNTMFANMARREMFGSWSSDWRRNDCSWTGEYFFVPHEKETFETYSKKAGRGTQFPENNIGTIIGCALTSKEDVDTALENVVNYDSNFRGDVFRQEKGLTLPPYPELLYQPQQLGDLIDTQLAVDVLNMRTDRTQRNKQFACNFLFAETGVKQFDYLQLAGGKG